MRAACLPGNCDCILQAQLRQFSVINVNKKICYTTEWREWQMEVCMQLFRQDRVNVTEFLNRSETADANVEELCY